MKYITATMAVALVTTLVGASPASAGDENRVSLGDSPVTASSAFSRANPATVRLHPSQGYGGWLGGRTSAGGLLRYQIDRVPNDDMTKMGRALFITSRSRKPIRYKAVLRSAKGTRVMTGWVGGKRKDGSPPMDWFWGLRRGETYKTIRVFRKG